MNRRSFISSLLAGLAAVPLALKAKTSPKPIAVLDTALGGSDRAILQVGQIECRGGAVEQRLGGKCLFTLPSEAGECLGMTMFNDCMVMAMENGIWVSNAPFNSCHKLSA